MVTGELPAAQRQARLADPQARAGVATMYSVEVGIDLVGYDVVIFAGLDWLPKTLLQAEARAHRIGQRRTVNVFFLVGLGTIDEVVRERVIDRLEAHETLTGNDAEGLLGTLAGAQDEESLLDAIVAGLAA